MDLNEVQRDQAEYDQEFWSHDPGFTTVRHSSLHLGKLIGKISTYCEAAEHGETADASQLDSEVVPDLLIFLRPDWQMIEA